jgi:hypothetical protein
VRIVAWNCGDGFGRKVAALDSLDADLAVVSEVRFKAIEKAKIEPERVAWVGKPTGKGIAIIGKPGWSIRAETVSFDDEWFLPVIAKNAAREIQVLGVWAQHKGVSGNPNLRALKGCSSFIRRAHTVVAGDFNSNVIWDQSNKKNRFADTLACMRDFGLISAWHSHHNEIHGQETIPTLCWRKSFTQVYHIDYVFVPDDPNWKITEVSIGSPSDWVMTGLSDHLPVIVTAK